MTMDTAQAAMDPTEDPMPVEGILVRKGCPTRGWARSLMTASMRMDALLAEDFQAMDFSDPNQVTMHSREVFIEGSVMRIQADYVCRSDSSHSRMLRVSAPRSTTSLLLDLHETEIPQGWIIPREEMRRHHALLVFRQFASVMRSLAARAGDVSTTNTDVLAARADIIGVAMGGQSIRGVTRLPWAFGDGIHGPGMLTGPVEPIPRRWAGPRTTMVSADRDAKGVRVRLSPFRHQVAGEVSAMDAMRAIASLPPVALRTAA
jgi:hypothetical protein